MRTQCVPMSALSYALDCSLNAVPDEGLWSLGIARGAFGGQLLA
jgi:hypothetical protein